MSATIELSPWQALQSHKVNCTKGCARKKIVCPVGKILLARAMERLADKGKHLMSAFPFVPRINERILCHIKADWVEAVVMEKSIQPAEMYEKFDYETGDSTWRTAAPKTIGYEVMLDTKERYYVRPYEIKSMRPQKVFKKVLQAIVDEQTNDDLIVRRS